MHMSITRRALPIIALAVMTAVAVPANACENLRLTFIQRPLSGIITDVGFPDVDSVGDLMTWSNKVYDQDNKIELGRDNGWCIRTAVGQYWECTWTLILADGRIMAAGTADDGVDFDLAVMGGTGAYIGVTGQMSHQKADQHGNLIRFVYDLRRCPR